ncbi:MAG: hypothetical protein LUC98_09480 [Lachnospiraceae bacterium]|nr:hypothetical protein [Lachnospiraceae bacterium]
MNPPEWFYDERIQKIAPEKLQLLMSLASQLDGKSSQKEMLPILLGAAASASRRGLSFTKDEFDLIFRIMKEGKSAEEQAQMDRTLEKAQQLFQQKR